MKFLLLSLFCIALPSMASEGDVSISEGTRDSHGFIVHNVKCPFQSGQTQIRVLLPDRLDPSTQCPAIYVLPVERLNEDRFGDGLAEAKKLDLHNSLHAILIAPTFSQLPWYADHPTDPAIRQETYLLSVVLPFIEKTYPVVPGRAGRLLLGFSKSGWGALSLLLRHPDIFAKAAAWDAPLMKDKPDQFGMNDIFATQENFEAYQITRLLEKRVDDLRGSTRLIVLGYGNFRDHHRQAQRAVG